MKMDKVCLGGRNSGGTLETFKQIAGLGHEFVSKWHHS